MSEDLEQDEEAPSISQWEFIDRIPVREDVVALLTTLPPVFGVRYEDFADYVQGLPSTKKQKVKVPTATGFRKEERQFEVVTLYMSVAGRIHMLNAAAQLNGWMVNFEPEPVTPTGVPGFLQMDDRLVYREYVVIRALMPGLAEDQGLETYQRDDLLGSKPGMAWVPSSGGSQAKGSNPYEKVETAARGRAIAAWGIGVLPGSGVASLEEMVGSRTQQAVKTDRTVQRKSREELLSELLQLSEEIRQLRGVSEDQNEERVIDYLQRSFGVDAASDAGVDWSKVTDGQLQLTLNAMSQSREALMDQERAV